MADVIEAWPLGQRLIDENGDPVAGGKLKFYAAGTSTARTVYSDPGLTASLGAVVTCDAGGFPASAGGTKVAIFTGVNAFKLVATDASDVEIWTLDNIPGAFSTADLAETSDVTGYGTGITTTNTISGNTTVATTDRGELFNVNCTGASVTMTLPSAVTAGDGWAVGIRHDGTANAVLIATVSSQTIQHQGQDNTVFALLARGEVAWLVSDGTGWIVYAATSAEIRPNMRVLAVEDVTSTPPGSPLPGQRYILGAAPSGAWSSFAEHDVVEWDGVSTWLKYTPTTDSGWLAYDRTDNDMYQFRASAWVRLYSFPPGDGIDTGSDTIAIDFAAAADMEAATSAVKAVSPSLQHRHPGHPKAWTRYQGTGTAALQEDYGITSLTDGGTGDYTFTLDTAMSSATYCGIANGNANGLDSVTTSIRAYTTTTMRVHTVSFDQQLGCVMAFGDQ